MVTKSYIVYAFRLLTNRTVFSVKHATGITLLVLLCRGNLCADRLFKDTDDERMQV